MNEEEKVDEIPSSEQKAEEDFKDKYFRLLAEMDNTRKRIQREKHEMTRFAVENVLAEVLLPIDTLENALSFTTHMNEETRNWARGFEMILSQFKEILGSHNVVAFHSKGDMFDPHKHEGVEIEETHEHPEGTILFEFLKGYKCGDRILRPARVRVAKKPSEQKLEKENKE